MAQVECVKDFLEALGMQARAPCSERQRVRGGGARRSGAASGRGRPRARCGRARGPPAAPSRTPPAMGAGTPAACQQSTSCSAPRAASRTDLHIAKHSDSDSASEFASGTRGTREMPTTEDTHTQCNKFITSKQIREGKRRTAAFGGGQDAGDALVRADQHVLAQVVRAVGERRVRRERHLHSARACEA